MGDVLERKMPACPQKRGAVQVTSASFPKTHEMAGEAMLPVAAALGEGQKVAFIFVRWFSDVFPK